MLTDPWYPGWKCRIDGNDVPVRRANYLFRGVDVPEGRHEIVFTFEPQSYIWGRRISLATLAVVSIFLIGTMMAAKRPFVGRG